MSSLVAYTHRADLRWFHGRLQWTHKRTLSLLDRALDILRLAKEADAANASTAEAAFRQLDRLRAEVLPLANDQLFDDVEAGCFAQAHRANGPSSFAPIARVIACSSHEAAVRLARQVAMKWGEFRQDEPSDHFDNLDRAHDIWLRDLLSDLLRLAQRIDAASLRLYVLEEWEWCEDSLAASFLDDLLEDRTREEGERLCKRSRKAFKAVEKANALKLALWRPAWQDKGPLSRHNLLRRARRGLRMNIQPLRHLCDMLDLAAPALGAIGDCFSLRDWDGPPRGFVLKGALLEVERVEQALMKVPEMPDPKPVKVGSKVIMNHLHEGHLPAGQHAREQLAGASTDRPPDADEKPAPPVDALADAAEASAATSDASMTGQRMRAQPPPLQAAQPWEPYRSAQFFLTEGGISAECLRQAKKRGTLVHVRKDDDGKNLYSVRECIEAFPSALDHICLRGGEVTRVTKT